VCYPWSLFISIGVGYIQKHTGVEYRVLLSKEELPRLVKV